MFEITQGKYILITNSHKNVIGLGGKDWFRSDGYYRMLYCGSFNMPTDIRYMHQVEDIEEYKEIIANIHGCLKDSKEETQKIRDKIKICEEYIAGVSSLDVIKTRNSSLYYKEQLKREEEVIEKNYGSYLSFKDLCVKDNKVIIPHRSEPFFYNTDVDLLQFEIGDILEIGFQDHPKAGKKYRGKTFQFVVNNLLEYEYRNKTRRLALTPVSEGWTKKDIIILDDSDRFECLMIDLFPCNRRPFAGWQGKNLSVKKTGSTFTLPKINKLVDLEKLLKIEPDDYVFSYDYEDNTFNGVYIRRNAQNLFWLCKVITSSDVKRAIEILKLEILDHEKRIANTEEYQAGREQMLSACSYLNYERFFDGIPYVEKEN